jgi:serine/threonine protein kinase/WD40 repeat protein
MNGSDADGQDDLDRSSIDVHGNSLIEEQERRLRALMGDFLERLQSGDDPDPSEMILAHPDIALELERRIAVAELLHGLGRSSEPANLGTTHSRDESPASRFPTDPPPNRDPTASQDSMANPLLSPMGRLGRYELREILGRGASSVVYRAHDTKFEREVALKVFRFESFGSSDGVHRFERDARLAAQLRHSNIVPLHDTDELEDLRYIDMELIRGETLAARLERLKGQPFDPKEAAELVRKIAEALDYAHRTGIVHRDVKPSNILIDERAEPQLTDFGLARQIAGATTITYHGQILGTPAYMSPEQAEGRSHEADSRSDIYSLGVVLYRMLTGRLPFEGTDSLTTLLARIVKEQPPSPQSLNPAISKDLGMICLRAMEKHPADRFRTAAAFADELRRWMNEEPLTIRPPTGWEKLRRWSQRNRLVTRVTAVFSMILLVLSLALGAIAWSHAIQVRYRAEAQVKVLLVQARQRLQTPTQGLRGDTQPTLRATAELLALIPDGQEKAALLMEIRSVFAATLGVPDIVSSPGDQVNLPKVFYQDWRVALHPDGKSMVIGTPQGPVRWVRGQIPKLPPGLDEIPPRPRVTYSPDGQFLAFAPAAGGIELWDSGVNHILAAWRPSEEGAVLSVGFQSGTLWACCAGGTVQSLALPDLRKLTSWKIKPLTAAVFSADATRLAAGDGSGRVQLHEITGRLLREWAADRIEITALAWSPDTRLVAVGVADGTVKLWDAIDGVSLHRWPAFPLEVDSILFDLDGRWLIAGCRGAVSRIWDVVTGRQILTGGCSPWGLSRNGRTIAMGATDRVAFGDLILPQTLRTLSGHASKVGQLAWSRDNRHLVTLDDRYEVRVWDVMRGVSVDEFRTAAGGFYTSNAAVALSDDARLVAYASGGETRSHALIRDVTTGKTLDHWELPGAFERIIYADGRFLLVREEEDEGSKNWRTRTVARILAVGKPPEVLRVVRPAEAGDDRGFLDFNLTPDGHYYLWVGPRLPVQNRRVEVRQVATGRLLRRIARPAGPLSNVDDATLDPQGRDLWVDYETGEHYRFDLTDADHPPERMSRSPFAISPDGLWLAFGQIATPTEPTPKLILQHRNDHSTWLSLAGDAVYGPNAVRFSPNGRFLAWRCDDGTVTVADLPSLKREVREFEESLGSR